MAAFAAREAAQAAEKQQRADVAAWWRHVEWNNEKAHGQTPAQRCPSYLRGAFARLRASNTVDADGEFTHAFVGAEE
jgi:hypothetical protein